MVNPNPYCQEYDRIGMEMICSSQSFLKAASCMVVILKISKFKTFDKMHKRVMIKSPI